MVFANFEELIEHVKRAPNCRTVAVAGSNDSHTLEAVLRGVDEGIVNLLLAGDKEETLAILKALGRTVPEDTIYHAATPAEACDCAVRLVLEGKADFLMKGKADTNIYLGAVINKEHGLGTGRLMSHFSILDVPSYHKLVVPVDGGMVPYPTLEQKKEIILNTVDTLRSMGCDTPKVAVLACAEKVNPKMPETIEANELKQMNLRGEIPNCIVEGPISYDCAMSHEIAETKGFFSPVAGDADVLLAPNIHAANILGKSLTVSSFARMAGFIIGTKCPVVMTSRGASADEKFLSIVLATAVTNG